ncbi:helix-turn-helix domain-containing protein [Bordetella genomosp. 13]|uniref:helix-turn-helix domain-containing protein n=1 Tax=Bordetella genomosp. 13 TaxID=463040 RepID=UPI0011AACEC1
MEPLLSPVQLATLLGISVQTIYNRRTRGDTLPPCMKVGGMVRYHPEDVRTWLTSQAEAASPCVSRADMARRDDIPRVARRGRPTKAEQLRRSRQLGLSTEKDGKRST